MERIDDADVGAPKLTISRASARRHAGLGGREDAPKDRGHSYGDDCADDDRLAVQPDESEDDRHRRADDARARLDDPEPGEAELALKLGDRDRGHAREQPRRRRENREECDPIAEDSRR